MAHRFLSSEIRAKTHSLCMQFSQGSRPDLQFRMFQFIVYSSKCISRVFLEAFAISSFILTYGYLAIVPCRQLIDRITVSQLSVVFSIYFQPIWPLISRIPA